MLRALLDLGLKEFGRIVGFRVPPGGRGRKRALRGGRVGPEGFR